MFSIIFIPCGKWNAGIVATPCRLWDCHMIEVTNHHVRHRFGVNSPNSLEFSQKMCVVLAKGPFEHQFWARYISYRRAFCWFQKQKSIFCTITFPPEDMVTWMATHYMYFMYIYEHKMPSSVKFEKAPKGRFSQNATQIGTVIEKAPIIPITLWSFISIANGDVRLFGQGRLWQQNGVFAS